MTYWVVPGAQLNSFIPTVVAIFLPLSSLWASANVSHRRMTDDAHRAIPVGGSDFASATAYGTLSADSGAKHTTDSDDTQASTLVDIRELYEIPGGAALDGSVRQRSADADGDINIDLEKQQLKRGKGGAVIDVSRTFSIRSD